VLLQPFLDFKRLGKLQESEKVPFKNLIVPNRIFERLMAIYAGQEMAPDELDILGELLSYLCCYNLDMEKIFEGEKQPGEESDDDEEIALELKRMRNNAFSSANKKNLSGEDAAAVAKLKEKELAKKSEKQNKSPLVVGTKKEQELSLRDFILKQLDPELTRSFAGSKGEAKQRGLDADVRHAMGRMKALGTTLFKKQLLPEASLCYGIGAEGLPALVEYYAMSLSVEKSLTDKDKGEPHPHRYVSAKSELEELKKKTDAGVPIEEALGVG